MVEKVERRESSTESDSSVSNCDLTCQHSGKRNESVTVIEPVQNGMWLGVIESIKYSDLLSFWIWRNIKVRYAQSSLGVGWAIIQPLFTMLIFTLVFGRLAKLDSDGVPYAIFSFAALVPWTFFSNSVSETTGSLIQNANMISKIYFPRLILPLATVLSKLVDFSISLIVFGGLLIWFRIAPTLSLLVLPVLILLMLMSALGIGILLSAMAIQFRDVKYGINFIVQLLMYIAPVVYPASIVPHGYTPFVVPVEVREFWCNFLC